MFHFNSWNWFKCNFKKKKNVGFHENITPNFRILFTVNEWNKISGINPIASTVAYLNFLMENYQNTLTRLHFQLTNHTSWSLSTGKHPILRSTRKLQKIFHVPSFFLLIFELRYTKIKFFALKWNTLYL